MAYCFNEAISMIGNWIISELEKIEGKNAKQIEARREATLKRLLSGGNRFASPAPTK